MLVSLGPIMPVLNTNVISGMCYMRRNHPNIEWDASVITLAHKSAKFYFTGTICINPKRYGIFTFDLG